MRYRHVYTPTDHVTITPEMVERWMAMEARLEDYIEQLKAEPTTFIQETLAETLMKIKDGKE